MLSRFIVSTVLFLGGTSCVAQTVIQPQQPEAQPGAGYWIRPDSVATDSLVTVQVRALSTANTGLYGLISFMPDVAHADSAKVLPVPTDSEGHSRTRLAPGWYRVTFTRFWHRPLVLGGLHLRVGEAIDIVFVADRIPHVDDAEGELIPYEKRKNR